MVLGPAVRALREALGIRHGSFAESVGISPGYLTKIESGSQQPRPDIARSRWLSSPQGATGRDHVRAYGKGKGPLRSPTTPAVIYVIDKLWSSWALLTVTGGPA